MDLLKNDQSIVALKNLVTSLEGEFATDKINQLAQPVRVFEKLRDIQAVSRSFELQLKTNLEGVTTTITKLL